MNREGTTRIRIATLVIIFAIAIRASYQQDSNVSSVDADGKWEYFSKCYDEIGCVRTDSNWYDEKFRPVNLKPVDRRIIKTDFVFIKLNRTKDASLKFGVVTPDVKSIKGSGFIKNEILYILIHDFTSNGYTGWIKHISEILLARKYVNVVSIDWRHGAEPPYDQAVANARVVALEIINLIKVLREHLSLDLEKVHIIGHGVGAHIAGYVGSVFGKIKKISGLDPNGPRFEGMPDMVRLDPSDAQYVEVLHTDAFRSISQGSTYAFGHSDFFLNNAKEQPGCAEKDSKNILTLKRDSVGEGTIVPGCSHKRSFKYFIEALEERECTFLGIQCENYEKFSKGKCATCGSKCKTFGGVTYHDPEPASYFLNTGIQYPYCMYPYRLTVHVGKKGKSQHYNGRFDLLLVDVASLVASSSMPESGEFEAGVKNTFIFYAKEPELGFIREARIKWISDKKKFCLFNCQQPIYVDKVVVSSLKRDPKQEKESVLCPKGNLTEIETGDYHIFYPC